MKAHAQPSYPFVPKSVTWLRPGQFWALPLSDQSFGCARVIDIAPKGEIGSRTSFLAGVLDWHSTALPTCEAIAGAPCLEQSNVHIRAITETGGAILGFRDLALDGIEPWLFRGAEFHPHSYVYRGLVPVRPQHRTTPIFPCWRRRDSGSPCLLQRLGSSRRSDH